ncbi:acyl carrier protein [Amycolatopsis anabasis]|uniref:acyl carrier protein n=1 Tax=Amycolatopsis anabasis TaxID=1840409 RepID=UPI00131D3842|nr:acyl carrier protein [Amycolatopsis anabasis]
MTEGIDRQTIVEAAIGLLAEMVRREPKSLTEETRLFEELGLDSVNTLELLMQLEEQLEFQFDADTLEQRYLETVGTLASYVAKQASV